METGKTSKYFKYAIGEIVLVVIGILIALQINNWNVKRVNSLKERLLLNELHNEFIKNKAQLQEVVTAHKEAMKSTQYVIAQLPINPKTIDLDALHTNMWNWGRRYTFNPSQGVVKSLVNSSSFDIISNPELRKLLVSWEDVLTDYQEEEINAFNMLTEHMLPTILNNLSWSSLKDKRFDTSYLASIEFENIFRLRELNLADILESQSGELKQITATIDQIIDLSKPEGND